jgi:hypothetical protein
VSSAASFDLTAVVIPGSVDAQATVTINPAADIRLANLFSMSVLLAAGTARRCKNENSSIMRAAGRYGCGVARETTLMRRRRA